MMPGAPAGAWARPVAGLVLGLSLGGTLQLAPAVVAAVSNLPLVILVGIPAWVIAIFTIALWWRVIQRRRDAAGGAAALMRE